MIAMVKYVIGNSPWIFEEDLVVIWATGGLLLDYPLVETGRLKCQNIDRYLPTLETISIKSISRQISDKIIYQIRINIYLQNPW